MGSTLFGISILLIWAELLRADGFVCAGFGEGTESIAPPVAAKLAQRVHEGTRSVVVIFAQFRDEEPGWHQVPAWSQDIFDPEKPGSFSHFYDTMSFGQLRVRGVVASRRYTSLEPASAYLSSDPTAPGRFGPFCLEILA